MPNSELNQRPLLDDMEQGASSQEDQGLPPRAEGEVPEVELSQEAAPQTNEPESSPPPLSQGQLDDVWRELRTSIRSRIQPEQFETWFRRAALESLSDGRLCIAVQNAFSKDWLNSYYRDVIEEAAQQVLSNQPSFTKKLRVEFTVDPELTVSAAPEDVLPADLPNSPGSANSSDSNSSGSQTRANTRLPNPFQHSTRNNHARPETQLISPAGDRRRTAGASTQRPGTVGGLVSGSDVGLNPRYTFDNFVVGPCNRFCHAVSLGAAEAPGKTYNPLFLHGSVGLGKTHLLQSICYSLIENWADVRILFLSCETFVNHFISALENGDLQKFRGKYRNVDVLVVDDIHVLANKERTQEEFFHTFNSLYNAGKQIILSSDSPPKDIPTLQDRLVSRFKWGLVTEIEPPCYETRMAILRRKGRDRGQELPDEVAHLIAEKVDTNIRELEGTINKLYSFSNVTGQAITVDFCREVLTDLFTKRRGQPSMDDIIGVVTTHFGVKLSDLQSKKRTNQIAFPRQVAMYLARKITRHSLEEIGGFFGGRDHSTVLHAVRKLTKLVDNDEQSRELIVSFLDDLQATGS